MTGFTYSCPNCSRKGSNSELSCFNCRGQIVIEERSGQKYLTCDNCGIDQLPSCPSCNAAITWKKISESGSIVGAIIGFVVLFFIIKSCSSGTSSKPEVEPYVPPAVNEAPPADEVPPPRWTVPEEDQNPVVVPSPPLNDSQQPAEEPGSSEPQWVVPTEE